MSCLLHCLLEVSRKLCFSLMQSMFCACVSVDFSHFCFFFTSLPSSSSPQIDSVAYLIAYTNNIYLLIFQILILVYGVLIFHLHLPVGLTCQNFKQFTYVIVFICLHIFHISHIFVLFYHMPRNFIFFIYSISAMIIFSCFYCCYCCFFFGQLFSFDIVLLSILI